MYNIDENARFFFYLNKFVCVYRHSQEFVGCIRTTRSIGEEKLVNYNENLLAKITFEVVSGFTLAAKGLQFTKNNMHVWFQIKNKNTLHKKYQISHQNMFKPITNYESHNRSFYYVITWYFNTNSLQFISISSVVLVK
jgi:hypothetical protein